MTGNAAASAASAEDTGSRATELTETSWPGAAISIASWSVQRLVETTRAGGRASGGAAAIPDERQQDRRGAHQNRAATPA